MRREKYGTGPDSVPREALASRIGAVVRAPLGDADRALPAKVFGALLGLGPFAERLWTLNPYGAAFASALFHRAQLTPKHLQEQLDALSPEAYAEFAARWLDEENRAAVVIALQ